MRSHVRPAAVLTCVALSIGAMVARACPDGASTQPAVATSQPTHLLTLYYDKGNNKGTAPLHMRLWLPKDWETAGTAGQRQCADHDGKSKPGEMPAIIDFTIDHGGEKYPGYVRFDFTTAGWHQTFDVEYRPPKDDKTRPFEWSWEYLTVGFGGDVRTGVSMSGHATLEPYQAPTTQSP